MQQDVEVEDSVGNKKQPKKRLTQDPDKANQTGTLAGSERVKKSEVSGRAFDEACFINNSLTCLGRCIAALAAQGKGGVRPPFRETKLPRLLSSAFGGPCSAAAAP